MNKEGEFFAQKKANASCGAPKLTKFSYCNKCDDSWTNEPPEFLVSQLVNDVTIV